MDNNSKFNDDLDFVVSHYREGAFSPDMHFGQRSGIFRHAWQKWAAASVIAVALGATAMVSYNIVFREKTVEPVPTTEQTMPQNRANEVIRLEFDNAPISEVAKGIEEAYGVKLDHLPTEDRHLSLSYEGTAQDLVDTINELLGCEITISETSH